MKNKSYCPNAPKCVCVCENEKDSDFFRWQFFYFDRDMFSWYLTIKDYNLANLWKIYDRPILRRILIDQTARKPPHQQNCIQLIWVPRQIQTTTDKPYTVSNRIHYSKTNTEYGFYVLVLPIAFLEFRMKIYYLICGSVLVLSYFHTASNGRH